MKVFLSHSNALAERAAQLSKRLSADGVEALSTPARNQHGQRGVSAVEGMVKNADAMVFIVQPGAERDKYLLEQWRLAIDQSWSAPEKPLIPVLVGDAQLPGFLKDRHAIPVKSDGDWTHAADLLADALKSGQASLEPAAANNEQTRVAEHKQRLDEITQEATSLEPSKDEFEQQLQLLRTRIEEERTRSPDSLELADLHVNSADILKRLTRDKEALADLRSAVDILARHSAPQAERRLARSRTNLAMLLWRLGEKEEAYVQLEQARDLYLKLDGPESLAVIIARAPLIQLLKELGREDEAAREKEAFVRDVVGKFKSFAPVKWLLDRISGRENKPSKNRDEADHGK
jgi:tetratricopeptide (TPR) repeat protein